MIRPQTILAGLLLSFGVVQTAAADFVTLDQSYTTEDGFYSFSAAAQAQTFTVGISGKLTGVDLLLGREPGGPAVGTGPVDVLIRSLVGGAPNGPELGAASVSDLNLPAGPPASYTSFDFSGQNITVNAGETLGIVVIPTAQNETLDWKFGRTTDIGGGVFVGGYPGGSALTATGANNGWVPLISLGDSGHPNTVDFDYDFKTFVSPTAVHVPSSFVLFGIGTIGLLGYRAARHFIRGNISAE